MRRILVVANQTLGGAHLLEEVRRAMAAGPCRFHVVVPATAPQDHAVWTEGEATALARERLDAALERFRTAGAAAEGEIGDQDPILAIADALADREVDGIILSTLPPGISKWMRLDLPSRVERRFEIPVIHVVVEAEPAPR
jgi:hypothetical protein